MEPQSDFEIGEADPNIIVIVDMNRGGKTVTNDAEAVVDYLVNQHGYRDIDQHRIIYSDGHGRWDGMSTVDGQFAGFVVFGADSREAAVSIARTRPEWSC